MKLLYSNTSPYARKVRIVASEKRIDVTMVPVVLADPDCPVNDHNPLGKIPVLILADGDSLYDSRVIAEYLDNRTPLAHLIPQDHSVKIWVRRWEALADGVCDAAIAAVMEGRRPEGMQDAAIIAKQLGKVERGLRVLNDDLGKNKWCVNDAFSLADIALGCVLGYLDLRYQHLDWQKTYPNLGRHYLALMQRASFRDTAPPLAK
ncbi:glutathione S-transferase N-terminal domain-containing protein [Methylobacillus gramineus]|uniref:glutathione S-transferase family protein n=1 Tax=Methylobacillus gramineus TaxID=755169 RepID=UPI001CFF9D2C|nr:glutathione S-transferase N-terminal domain-containing protein [Methylobacillus gramineus]MCB5186355.1 glutathione S-transferase N-terminal domain-containing protein [Methylobacillus gramineus]